MLIEGIRKFTAYFQQFIIGRNRLLKYQFCCFAFRAPRWVMKAERTEQIETAAIETTDAMIVVLIDIALTNSFSIFIPPLRLFYQNRKKVTMVCQQSGLLTFLARRT
nr:MAG TPA: hypothetical protein [Caudoviricetes sp.]